MDHALARQVRARVRARHQAHAQDVQPAGSGRSVGGWQAGASHRGGDRGHAQQLADALHAADRLVVAGPAEEQAGEEDGGGTAGTDLEGKGGNGLGILNVNYRKRH